MTSRIILIFSLFLISIGAFSVPAYEVFTENGKQGLRDTYGKVVIPPQFDALGWTNAGNEVKNGKIGFLKNGSWGLVSTSNEILYPADLDAIYDATSNHIVAGKKQINGRYKKGLINYEGKVIISYAYNFIKVFETNLIAVKDKHFGLLNFQEKEVIPFKYSRIEHVADLRWIAWDDQQKGALFTSEGERLTDFAIDSINNFNSGVAIAWKKHLAGLLNRDGKWVLPVKYKSINVENKVASGELYSDYTFFNADQDRQLIVDSVKVSNDYLLAFASGVQWVLDNELNKISPSGSDIKVLNDLAAIKEGNFFRIYHLKKQEYYNNEFYKDLIFINKEIFIAKEIRSANNDWSLFKVGSKEPVLTGIGKVELKDERIKIKRKDYWGFYDKSGNEILPTVYNDIKSIKGDKFLVEFHNAYGIINSKEEWLIPPVDSRRYEKGKWVQHEILDFNDTHYISFDGLNYNLFDYRGKRIYFSIYPLALKESFIEEYKAGGQNNRIGFNGRSIKSFFGKTKYKEVLPLKEGLIGIKHQGMYGFIDPQNRLLIANRYEGIHSFNEGKAGIKLRGKWGAIDQMERLVVQPIYDSIGDFSEGMAIVEVQNRFGIIDGSGDILVPVEYDNLQLINDHFIIVEKEGRAGVVNRKGNMILWPRYDEIILENKHFIVMKDGKYGLHDHDGLAVLPPVYDQILSLKEGGLLVGKKQPDELITLP
ncbi:MAG: WG repeat-containing protein [Candidatus Cyclobacteriaceae bacterium M2_1C_046]